MNNTVDGKKKFGEILKQLAAKRFSKNEKIALVVIVVIIALIGNHLFNKWINSMKNSNNVIVTMTPPIQPKLPDSIIIKKTEPGEIFEPEKKIEIIRDPFLASKNPEKIQTIAMKKPTTQLKLSGILWDDRIPSAIINSKIVEIGDLIEGKTVVDIERDRVIVMEDGKIFIIELRKQ